MKGYRFRVLIDTNSDQEIFRDIVLLPDQTFEVFHKAIIQAFNFMGDQMASFYMSNEEWDKGQEIGLMDMGFGNPEFGPAVMSKSVLSEFVKEDHQKILYVYDFLRMWCFYIELIELVDVDANTTYPTVMLSFGDAPAETSKEIPDLFDGIEEEAPEKPKGESVEDVFKEFEDDFDDQSFENLDDYEGLV